jgi:hypothetical protein
VADSYFEFFEVDRLADEVARPRAQRGHDLFSADAVREEDD